MKQIIPINVIVGVSRTIYAHYALAGWHDFDPTSPIPHTAILEIEMEEARPIQVAQIYDKKENPMNGRVYSQDGIAPTLRTPTGGLSEPKIIEPAVLTPRRTDEQRELRKQGIDTFGCRQMLPRTDGVANTITTVQKDNLLQEPTIVQLPHGYFHCGETDIAPTIKASAHAENNYIKVRFRIRKLTPREALRLMDMDDEDIDKIDAYRIKTTLKDGTVKEKPIAKSQKYKLAGNSIVVSCLYHIFKGMFIDEKPQLPPKQLSLFDDL